MLSTHRGINPQPRIRVAPQPSQLESLFGKLRVTSHCHLGKGLRHSPVHCGSCTHLTRRAGKNTQKLCSPLACGPRQVQAEMRVDRTETYLARELGVWVTLKKDNKALPALELLLPLYLSEENNSQLHLSLKIASCLPNQQTQPDHMERYRAHLTSLLTVTTKQKTQPVIFPIC